MKTNMAPETMPAFPLHNGDVWGGMTMRDYFAARCLQGMCTWRAMREVEQQEEAAELAYSLADAMLKARTE